MRGLITIVSVILCLLIIVEVKLQSVVAESAPPPEVEDEPTCSLNPSEKGDCSTYEPMQSDYNLDGNAISAHRDDLTRQVISLTDENFNELTLTSTPATWLIMFKTDACGICKKARPVLEELSIDENISIHNDGEMEVILKGSDKEKQQSSEQSLEEDTEGEVVPKGPIYIATIDASWSGRDVSKRFSVDATPTIILLRNEGYDGIKSKVDSRSYYIYRGQRATYPLRMFVLGGYTHRKRLDMPPPILDEERKPQTYWGRIKEYIFSPATNWIGSLVGKFLLAWFVFIGGLGLFMRIHNYAWGENADDHDAREEKQKKIEKEKAQGRKEYEQSLSSDERSARRQKIIWDLKAKNHA